MCWKKKYEGVKSTQKEINKAESSQCQARKRRRSRSNCHQSTSNASIRDGIRWKEGRGRDEMRWKEGKGWDGRGWLTFDSSRKDVPLPWRVKGVSRGLCSAALRASYAHIY